MTMLAGLGCVAVAVCSADGGGDGDWDGFAIDADGVDAGPFASGGAIAITLPRRNPASRSFWLTLPSGCPAKLGMM